MKPRQVSKDNEAKLWEILWGQDLNEPVRFKFAVGDRVRVSKVK